MRSEQRASWFENGALGADRGLAPSRPFSSPSTSAAEMAEIHVMNTHAKMIELHLYVEARAEWSMAGAMAKVR